MILSPRTAVFLLISALLLAAPALAQKVDPRVEDPFKLEAQGGWLDPIEGGAPPNDLCQDAIGVAVPSVTAGTTAGAGIDEPPAFFCGTSVTSPGVWYTVVGDGTTYTANTCTGATNYDSKISVFCQDCDNLACVGGNDDTCGLQSEVVFCSQPGAEYSILVHGFGGDSGPFELDVSSDGVDCVPDVQCLPEGACCNGEDCEVTTEAECAASGGDYQGDDTACVVPDGNPITGFGGMGEPIADDLPPAVSTINIADSLVIGDVNVDLTITHTWIGDMTITLEHDGAMATLWDGGCSSEDNMDVTIDDEGSAVVCAQPTVGDVDPLSVDGTPLSVFDGLDSAGDWTLTIVDNAGGDDGTLDAWGLEIDSGSPVCVLPDVPVTEIPTLDTVGLSLLVLALAAGAAFVLRRRSRSHA